MTTTDSSAGIMVDMHTHSRNSHDSSCLVEDMALSEYNAGVSIMMVTDHIDIQLYGKIDNDTIAFGSHEDVDIARGIMGNKIKILKGMEIGEAFWYPDHTLDIIRNHPCDAIIGSVHGVKFGNTIESFSGINFMEFSDDDLYAYLQLYFDDYMYMLKNCDFDIAAHLTNPLYYMNYKYKRGVDIHRFDKDINDILDYIVANNITLEVNSHYINSLGCYMPETDILKLYYDKGGRFITTGSDAHVSSDAALGFDTLYNTLWNIGFENIYYFENRKPVCCKMKYN